MLIEYFQDIRKIGKDFLFDTSNAFHELLRKLY